LQWRKSVKKYLKMTQ